MTEREARVSDAGCAVFLGIDELQSLGVDPEETDTLAYSVIDGQIRLSDN